MKSIITLLLIAVLTLTAQPKREFRAVWLATVSNIDWPSTKSLTSSAQKAEVIAILDKHKQSNFNAILLQIRPSCDAFYQNGLEPLSEYLVGTQGGNLSSYYDPLQFWVEEAHKRGMELHAWINPYRSVVSSGSSVHSTHISRTKPEWNITYGGSPYKLLNPGIPEVKNYVTNVIMDIVRRYDIDGVHFDDYFYPYGGMTTQDTATYSAYKGSFNNIADWRRNNVNTFVAMVHDSIKAVKPWVKFGISPFGIWKSGIPAGVSGLSGYSAIYCDALNWLQNLKVDYITPQLYWVIGGGQDYSKLMPWWVSQLNGRHLYTGNAVYRINDSNWPATEIQNQIELNRVQSRALGFVAFSSKSVTQNYKGIQDSLRTNQFKYPAIQPAMPWLNSISPTIPTNLIAASISDSVTLQWQKGPVASDGDSAYRYVVYSDVNQPIDIDISNSTFIRSVVSNGEKKFVDKRPSLQTLQYQAIVTSIDRFGNESPAGNAIYVSPSGKPFMSLNQLSLNLNDAAIGQKVTGTIKVFNRSASSLTIDSVFSSSNVFSSVDTVISIADSFFLPVSFTPQALGSVSDTLYIRNNSLLGTVKIAVQGNSPAPLVKLVSNVVQYGNVNVGDSSTQSVFITNQSLNAVRIDSMRFVTSSMQKFTLLDGVFPATIQKNDTSAFSFMFVPDTIKFYLDTLLVYSNSQNSPTKVILYGIGRMPLSVDREGGLQPLAFSLHQNFPNPFNPSTNLRFTLQQGNNTTLTVYDMLGREIAIVVDDYLGAGSHTYQFNGSNLASGVYLYRIVSGSFVETKKMILQK
jgi:uncharacterized lipoprotein YddW (UPF0748 family)